MIARRRQAALQFAHTGWSVQESRVEHLEPGPQRRDGETGEFEDITPLAAYRQQAERLA
jgi:hypothetical protein